MSNESKRIVFLDTETTGMVAVNEYGNIHDRIIEIGLVEVIDRRKTGRTLHLYITSDKEVDEGAERVHNLSQDDVKRLSKGKEFKDVVQQIFDFIGQDEIMAHNAEFDQKFIDAELRNLNLPTIEERGIPVSCTKKLADRIFIGQRNNLDALCNRLGIDKSRREAEGHGALLDTELLVEVFLSMTTNQLGLLNSRNKKPQVNLLTELSIDKIDPSKNQKLESMKASEGGRLTEDEIKKHNKLAERIKKDSKDNSYILPF